ncbi:M50 family metallopeptidase [Desulfosporosinus sp. BICA1-9]|uniref:M50 family metallopeptidase n=1 Tax=Desulfosporosinus sp. BICA1-9 TaxID=1531958 RepID=UPI00054BF362|nr:M50 family metallopeptidase [Desulfosporosinus sp. BICA1-9]KJS50329.1 MAG: peptidase M50 [Peptococcaceae bacterium BRH_c23]KJS88619.1 MAG: peptidase M50 [Desulfosporosinus sp. BICA1-9]HBW35475.1 peptidase M50 [Desulfosporosinus sp.]
MELVKLFGVSIRIHPTFLLVLLLYGVLGLAAQALLVFALVLGHELAHLLTAKAYGFKVVGLELFPFGGAAYCDDLFEGRKLEESIMALAGPAFNIVLLFAAQVLRWNGFWTGEFSDDFVRYNFWLGAFNLIPVLPLDGGRVVRALFVGGFGFVRTTKFLAWAGKWLGVIFALYGIILGVQGKFTEGPLFFLILGGFFWLAGSKEISTAHITFLRQLTRKKEELMKKGLMRNICVTVQSNTPLVRIVEEFTPDRYAMVSLTNGKMGMDKILTETDIVEGMLREGIHFPVGKL